MVVPALSGAIRCVPPPMDAARACALGARMGSKHQRLATTSASCLLAGEQILQVAGGSEHGRVAMKDVVRGCNQTSLWSRGEDRVLWRRYARQSAWGGVRVRVG